MKLAKCVCMKMSININILHTRYFRQTFSPLLNISKYNKKNMKSKRTNLVNQSDLDGRAGLYFLPDAHGALFFRQTWGSLFCQTWSFFCQTRSSLFRQTWSSLFSRQGALFLPDKELTFLPEMGPFFARLGFFVRQGVLSFAKHGVLSFARLGALVLVNHKVNHTVFFSQASKPEKEPLPSGFFFNF